MTPFAEALPAVGSTIMTCAKAGGKAEVTTVASRFHAAFLATMYEAWEEPAAISIN